MATNFNVDDGIVQTTMIMKLAQNLNLFNSASNGTLLMSSRLIRDNNETEAFLDAPAGAVRRATDESNVENEITDSTQISIKLQRTSTYKQTLTNLQEKGLTGANLSMAIGEYYASDQMKTWVNDSVGTLATLVAGNSNMLFDATLAGGTTSLTQLNMTNGMEKYGDNFGNIKAWLMHTTSVFQLVKDGVISSNDVLFQMFGLTIYKGTIATGGIPIISSSIPDLKTTGVPNTYITLGLVAAAIEVVETMEPRMLEDTTSLEGNESVYKKKLDFDFILKILGYSYTLGTANPTNAQLKNATNWTVVYPNEYTAACGIKTNDA